MNREDAETEAQARQPAGAPPAEAEVAEAERAGRARVREVLIRRLEADGLVRPRGATVAEHGAFLDRLADRLSYLPERDLVVLADCVLRRAGGRQFNEWPAFATIWNLAQTICRTPEPDERRHIMTTWLRSRGGPIARDGGYLVELWRYLRAFGAPPGSAALDMIRREADENRRTRARLSALRERGAARPEDLDWLESYARAEAYCLALVARGEDARALRGETA
ncbi:MAG: hypothetical protein ACK4TJ_00855 [Tabrizicola sp.]